MMTWNIIVKSASTDNFILREDDTNKVLVVPFYEPKDDLQNAITHHIFDIVREAGLSPTPNVIDLMRAALAVYASDQLISREEHGYFNWSRHFKLHLPVMNPEVWNTSKGDLEALLSFLSGDKWEVNFRQNDESEYQPNPPKYEGNLNTVSLFSGGLDSFIGVVDLAENPKNNIALVGHHKSGPGESSAQTALHAALVSQYEDGRFSLFPFYAQPNQKHQYAGKENTSRARSILFIALGIMVANSLGENVPLIIPENGLISLNIPLTNARLGSLSTRTTHPYFLNKLMQLLNTIEIKNKLIAPYQHFTKGEMISNCLNKHFVESNIETTISCAHPSASRYAGAPSKTQCGYCTPCIIRRAAIHKSKIKDSNYLVDVTTKPPAIASKKGRDLRAFKLALTRLRREKPKLFLHVLSSGPLPVRNQNELNDYINVYQKGMQEVEDFLKSKNT